MKKLFAILLAAILCLGLLGQLALKSRLGARRLFRTIRFLRNGRRLWQRPFFLRRLPRRQILHLGLGNRLGFPGDGSWLSRSHWTLLQGLDPLHQVFHCTLFLRPGDTYQDAFHQYPGQSHVF